jgi:cell wall-associated NlpC family hydrolase
MDEEMRTREEKKRLRERVAELARRQLGKPYVYGAAPSAAPRIFDCSSLVQYLYKRIGIELPRTTIEQARMGKRVRPPYRKNLKVGDIMLLRGKVGRYDRLYPQGIGHVILVTGPDEVIHAKFRKVGGKDAGEVKRQRLSTILKRKDIIVVRRII